MFGDRWDAPRRIQLIAVATYTLSPRKCLKLSLRSWSVRGDCERHTHSMNTAQVQAQNRNRMIVRSWQVAKKTHTTHFQRWLDIKWEQQTIESSPNRPITDRTTFRFQHLNSNLGEPHIRNVPAIASIMKKLELTKKLETLKLNALVKLMVALIMRGGD